jgi:hypothetical protein
MPSKVLSIGLALISAAILVGGHTSVGEAKGDECKAKPDGTAPAGLHWYYRVDRANDRHCWYLHQQGMRVHSLINTASRNSDSQNDTAGEQAWRTPPVTPQPVTPQPEYQSSATTAYQPSATTAHPPAVDFGARWVDLPRSVDLNAHEFVAESNGYAAEHAVDKRQGQLPPAWTNVSAANPDMQPNAGSQTNFGSISLAGAVVLALILISEALVRFARASAWHLLRFKLRADSRRSPVHSEPAGEAAQHDPISHLAAEAEPISRTETGVSELRRLLQRAGTGLRPPQSFAPSGSVHRHEPADRARADSTFARLKSRSFSGMTWAPL